MDTAREEIRIGQLAIRFLLEGYASGGSVAVFEFDVPVGAKVPIAHSHDGYEETIYGLEGVLTFTVDGRASDVGPREVLCIPCLHFDEHVAMFAERLGAKLDSPSPSL